MGRRRLANAFSNLAYTTSDLMLNQLQHQQAMQRQDKQIQAQQLKEMLDAFNTDTKALMDPAKVAEYGPERAAAAYQQLKRRLPQELHQYIGQDPDFTSLDSTAASRIAPTRKRIAEATSAAGVPQGSDILNSLISSRVTPTEHMGDLTNLMNEANTKREDLIAQEPSTAVNFIDEGGTKRTKYVKNRNLTGENVQADLTSAQNAAREGAQTKATAQAKMDVENDLTNQRNTARGAYLVAAAQTKAKLAEELSQMGVTAQQQTGALQLHDDYMKESSNFWVRRDSLNQIASAAKQGTAAGDMALVFSFMKMQDPGSTVREGEYANAKNAAGIPEKIRNQWNRLLDGEFLAPAQRQDFLNTAKNIYSQSKKEQDERNAIYTDKAKQLRVPPSLVLVQLSEPDVKATVGPTPGQPNQPGSALSTLRGRAQGLTKGQD